MTAGSAAATSCFRPVDKRKALKSNNLRKDITDIGFYNTKLGICQQRNKPPTRKYAVLACEQPLRFVVGKEKQWLFPCRIGGVDTEFLLEALPEVAGRTDAHHIGYFRHGIAARFEQAYYSSRPFSYRRFSVHQPSMAFIIPLKLNRLSAVARIRRSGL